MSEFPLPSCSLSVDPCPTQDVRMEDFLPAPSSEQLSSIRLSMDPATSIVPRTAGAHCRLGKQRCLVVFFSDGQSPQRALYFAHEMEKTPNIMVQSKELTLDAVAAENIFGSSSYNKAIESGPVIGFEYVGDSCSSCCQGVAKAIATDTGSTGMLYVSMHPAAAGRQIEALFGATLSSRHFS